MARGDRLDPDGLRQVELETCARHLEPRDPVTFLIVPLVLSSIVTGVAGVGSMRDLRRLGGKTFAYYVCTSLLAILLALLPGSRSQELAHLLPVG